MERIASHSNQHLKHARRVRDGHVDGYFYVEGKRLSEELLKSEIAVVRGFVTTKFADKNAGLLNKLAGRTENIDNVDADLFDSISGTKSPQGISFICHIPVCGKSEFENIAVNEKSLLGLLVDINNPGNLGAVIRSAEAFRADGLLISEGSAHAFNAASVRGSMGSAFRMPIWENLDFEEAVLWAGQNGYQTICADVDADVMLNEVEWQPKTLIVFGSEAHGLNVKKRSFIDSGFRIPMNPVTESLNLATAASIALYEARR